jgi:hypothetical protein
MFSRFSICCAFEETVLRMKARKAELSHAVLFTWLDRLSASGN